MTFQLHQPIIIKKKYRRKLIKMVTLQNGNLILILATVMMKMKTLLKKTTLEPK
jgi:hypothetical protein